jgi:hypothetical protein
MIYSKHIFLSAVFGGIIVLGIAFYLNWSARSTHGAPPAALVCRMHLREIDAAKAEWAVASNKTTNDTPTWEDLRPFLARNGEIPICPSGGTYKIGRIGESPSCSYPNHTLQ